MAEYRDRYPELQRLGYDLAALSVDAPEASRALAADLRLPFTLLCDTSREVVQTFHLYNRAEKGGIAFPATFVLDESRVVRFRSLDRTAARVNLDGLFAFLREGKGASAPATPKRSTVLPTLGDWARILRNAWRFGLRSPKR